MCQPACLITFLFPHQPVEDCSGGKNELANKYAPGDYRNMDGIFLINIRGTMITSVANQRIKNTVQLIKSTRERKKQGVFVAEGIHMFLETPQRLLSEVYVSEAFLCKEENQKLLCTKRVSYEVVSKEVFERMADTITPQGILCIVQKPVYEFKDLLCGKDTHLLVLENIQDPGNLGTMFRTGEGAGITGVVLNKGCVDLFSPKTVRSTMGSIYRVPYYITDSLPDVFPRLKQQGILTYAAHGRGEKCYDAFDFCKGTAFLIGNEGNGLTKEMFDLADNCLKIPMGGCLESLNAAMAAGILMYEVNRQRRRLL